MDEETLRLLTDLHIHNYRQGPGSEEAFLRMLELSGIDTKADLEIVDIGSGTGSSTIPLLRHTSARITAVDFLAPFLAKVAEQVASSGEGERVITVQADMTQMPFTEEQFDVIWSEGAIYNIGFEKGIREWKRYLKQGGVLVVSEITWLTSEIPEPLKTHWTEAYPEIDVASRKIALLEQQGYTPVGYFPLSPDCWLKHYYEPLEAGFADFLERHDDSDAAKKIVEAEEKEIALYKQYGNFYSYGVYIAKKIV